MKERERHNDIISSLISVRCFCPVFELVDIFKFKRRHDKVIKIISSWASTELNVALAANSMVWQIFFSWIPFWRPSLSTDVDKGWEEEWMIKEEEERRRRRGEGRATQLSSEMLFTDGRTSSEWCLPSAILLSYILETISTTHHGDDELSKKSPDTHPILIHHLWVFQSPIYRQSSQSSRI